MLLKVRYRWIFLICFIFALAWAFVERRTLLMQGFALMSPGGPPPLLEKSDEGAATRWHDDYFTIQEVAPQTFAIGEPRYAQQNFNYLIVGAERALLFDAGPGIRDIREVAEALTDKPIVFLPSHFHYDHVGNQITFDEIAVVDLPYVRDRAEGDRLAVGRMEHLGMLEGFSAPTWQVDYWWPIGSSIDLGQRSLTLLHTPGHTNDSVSLWDKENGIVFTGDYLYLSDLYAFGPSARMGDYLSTSQSLLSTLPDDVLIYGAHRGGPPGAPELVFTDLVDLNRSLESIKDRTTSGEGFYPQVFRVNDRIVILAEPRWLQDWD